MGIIRRHFLACEDIAGGSDLSAGGTFFSQNTEALPTYSPRTVRNKEELSLHATMDPAVSLSTYSPLPMDVVHRPR